MSAATRLLTEVSPAAIAAGLHQLAVQPDWLRAAVDRERVRAALEQHVAEFSAGVLRLRACNPYRLRLKNERWNVMYELTVDGLSGADGQIVTITGTLGPPELPPERGVDRGSFGSPEWHCYLPELGLDLYTYSSDTTLVALPRLTDPQHARELLEQSIRACSPGYRDIEILACRPKVVRYKPGSRATILYHLEYAGDRALQRGWPAVVVAKTYRGDKGLNAYNGMRKLWESPLSSGDTVTVAEPLAYIPELKVLVQGPIREEQTLKDLLRKALRDGTRSALDDLAHFMRKTAAGLAALHQSGAHHGQIVTWDDEVAEIRELIDRIAVPVPAMRDAARPLLSWLEGLASAHPADPPLPAHHSFRPAQVLIHREHIGFIDFDGFCQAEPSLDMALFRATVKDIGLNKMQDREDEIPIFPSEKARLDRLRLLDDICELFLSQYQTCAPVSAERVVLWEALDILTYALHCWTKVKPHHLGNTMLTLGHHVRQLGLPA